MWPSGSLVECTWVVQAEHVALVAAVEALQGKVQAQDGQLTSVADLQQQVASRMQASAEHTEGLKQSHQSRLDSICDAISGIQARSDKVGLHQFRPPCSSASMLQCALSTLFVAALPALSSVCG